MTNLQKRRRCTCKECIKFPVWSRKKEGHLEREKIEELKFDITVLRSIQNTQAVQLKRSQDEYTDLRIRVNKVRELI